MLCKVTVDLLTTPCSASRVLRMLILSSCRSLRFFATVVSSMDSASLILTSTALGLLRDVKTIRSPLVFTRFTSSENLCLASRILTFIVVIVYTSLLYLSRPAFLHRYQSGQREGDHLFYFRPPSGSRSFNLRRALSPVNVFSMPDPQDQDALLSSVDGIDNSVSPRPVTVETAELSG